MKLADAFGLGQDLLVGHGLGQWRLEFDQAKTRAGVCRPGRKLIGLSAPLTRLHTEEEVRDTILHEIAHALVGAHHGHDEVWRAKAREIGCSATRCLPEDAPKISGGWVGTCSAGHSMHRHRRPEQPMSCRACGQEFRLEHLFEWLYHGRPVPMHPNYVAVLAAIESAGSAPLRLPVGAAARVVAEGPFHGHVGEIIKRGRTCYHLRHREGVLRVPFSYVEPTQ
ncbi:MAG TPA: SprT-like domain-containing protein [Nocardioidaceae bacterium]|nr:SprT-like domain-containing protein [Nocardioidaceae bacterium]